MGYFSKTVISVLLAFLLQRVVVFIGKMGFNKYVHSHVPGPCFIIDDKIQGSHDIQTLSSGLALISSGWKLDLEHTAPKNVFYVYDFNKPTAGVRKVPVLDGVVENAHGFSIWEEPDSGEVTVFVVSHALSGDRIEKLRFDAKYMTLTHLETIEDPAFVNLNDVLAVSEDTFYATNLHTFSSDVTMIFAIFLGFQPGDVVYYSGVRAYKIADGFSLASGINISPDGEHLYVASFMAETIDVFHRTPDNNLLWDKSIRLHTFPNFIDVDKKTGDLWVGTNPILYKTIQYPFDSMSKPAPSHVLRLKMKNGNAVLLDEVYADEGNGLLYESPIVSYYAGNVLIGSAGNQLLRCKVLHLT